VLLFRFPSGLLDFLFRGRLRLALGAFGLSEIALFLSVRQIGRKFLPDFLFLRGKLLL
jgi:hypothetical protein